MVLVLVNPDESWVVCHIYKKKKHMPRVIAQVYNIAEGGKVAFYNFLKHKNSKEEGSNRTDEKANSSEVGNWVRMAAKLHECEKDTNIV